MQSNTSKVVMGAIMGAAVSILLIVIVAISICGDGLTAHVQPGKTESAVARWAYRRSIPAAYRNMTNQMPSVPENLHEGMEHYADHCASCHANNGSGDTMYGRGLSPRPPDLRAAATQEKSDGELYYVIEHGARWTGMPAFGQPSGGHDHGSWNLVLFIRHLPALTPQEEVEMQGMNPITPNELKEKQAEEEFLSGKQ